MSTDGESADSFLPTPIANPRKADADQAVLVEQPQEDDDELPAEYGSHGTYYAAVAPAADDRASEIVVDLRNAFAEFIAMELVEIVYFSKQTVDDLAKAIYLYPAILKSLLVVCNIAGRAIKRDLDMTNFNTYARKISHDKANQVAGFIKAFLPPSIPVLALIQADRNAYIDKEMRANKGRWEIVVTGALCLRSGLPFKKYMFKWLDDAFELDSAVVDTDEYTGARTVRYGVDVKRIEAVADIHKRADEIVNKAVKLKEAFPAAKFGAIIYFPMVHLQTNLSNRLRSSKIDSLQFASQAQGSIELAVSLMLGTFGVDVLDGDGSEDRNDS